MKLLIGIQGHASAQSTIDLNAESWRLPRCDVVGLQGDDSLVERWPSYLTDVKTIPLRKDCKWIGYGLLPTLMADAIGALVGIGYSGGYDAILWTECDSVFFGPVREVVPNAFNAFIAGFCPPEWNCGSGAFLHPPFFMDLRTALIWSLTMKEMDTHEGNGTSDVFAAKVCSRAGIRIVNARGVWSTNGLDMRLASKLKQAREEVAKGAWHIHGIKRADHLDYITKKTDAWPSDTIWQ